eukprot:4273300-Ditylum_brightwellii.AAC.1
MSEFHPLALVAGTKANPNALCHREAMKVEDRELFIQAMEEEIERMVEKDIFEVVPRSRSHISKSSESNLVTQKKKKTTGEVYRHRSRVCANGSKQQNGIDFHETYSPVVQWST